MITNNRSNGGDEEWAPVSDLMAALMLIFMLIAIVFIRTVVVTEQVHREECDKIFQVLDHEFQADFERWGAELDDDLTIRFYNHEVLFKLGSANIRGLFKKILSNFFPRYLKVTEEFKDDIREIRIEGHTSSEFGDLSPENAYLENMKLSQLRTVAILNYILTKTAIRPNDYRWSRNLLTANGLSSSKLIMVDSTEDKPASRRVEFRLVVTACQKAGVYKDAVHN